MGQLSRAPHKCVVDYEPMNTTATSNSATNDVTENRVLSLLGVLALQGAGLFVLVFWAMGAVLLWTGNGGQINDIYLAGIGRTFYFLYPVALAIFSVVGWLFFWLRRDLLAMLTLSVPAGLVVLYYFILIFPVGARV